MMSCCCRHEQASACALCPAAVRSATYKSSAAAVLHGKTIQVKRVCMHLPVPFRLCSGDKHQALHCCNQAAAHANACHPVQQWTAAELSSCQTPASNFFNTKALQSCRKTCTRVHIMLPHTQQPSAAHGGRCCFTPHHTTRSQPPTPNSCSSACPTPNSNFKFELQI